MNRNIVSRLEKLAEDSKKEQDKLDQVYRILQELYYESPSRLKETVKTAMDLLEE